VGQHQPLGSGLDLLLWDYGTNDLAHINDHSALFSGLMEQSLRHHPGLAGFGFAYWGKYKCMKDGGHTTANDELFQADYLLLKNRFHPNGGKFGNLTVLTSSLGAFCSKAKCSFNDVIGVHTAHPSTQGISFMADVFIWQMLRLFKNVYIHSCSKPTNSAHKINAPWIDDNKIEHHIDNTSDVYPFVKQIPMLMNLTEVPSHQVVASMKFSSPVLRDPLPAHLLSYLCIPADTNLLKTKNIRAFNFPDQVPTPLHFVPLDIVEIISQNCAGWVHEGGRLETRFDDEHAYWPSTSVECPDHEIACSLPPVYNNRYIYPSAFVPNMKMIKVVDLTFRFHVDLAWRTLCFLNCQPHVVWNDLKTIQLKSEPLNVTSNDPLQLGIRCLDRPNLPSSETIKDGHYYIYFPADVCYPLNAQSNEWRTGVDAAFFLFA
jgi:hypothetical protein